MSALGEYALFKIGNIDFTKNILANPPYTVNSKEIYEDYSDGGYKFRRRVIRNRVSGAFSMKFETSEDYDNFIQTLENSKGTDTSITCTVYVRNLRNVVTNKFYIEYDPPTIDPLLGYEEVDPLEITIQEQ